MDPRKIDFSSVEWSSLRAGARSKEFENGEKRVRLVEFLRNLDHPEWCETGHVGYVIDGELEIIFGDQTFRYSSGDVFVIHPGQEEKHIPKPVSEKVTMLLVEDTGEF